MKLRTKIALGLFALASPAMAEDSLENKIIDNPNINKSNINVEWKLYKNHFISKPSTIQTQNGEINFIKTNSRYLLTQYLIKNNDGVKKHHTADFDCDGKKDYSVEAKDGTKYVYFSSEGQSNPLDIKTWYVFPKNKEIIRPGYE
jgi:hypothetical protein